jgi:hypothetical protein
MIPGYKSIKGGPGIADGGALQSQPDAELLGHLIAELMQAMVRSLAIDAPRNGVAYPQPLFPPHAGLGTARPPSIARSSLCSRSTW